MIMHNQRLIKNLGFILFRTATANHHQGLSIAFQLSSNAFRRGHCRKKCLGYLGFSHAESGKNDSQDDKSGIEQECPPAHGAKCGQEGLANDKCDEEVDRGRKALAC